MEQQEVKIAQIATKSVMTKSNTPLGGYSVNPYVGCPHACKYCYASFMKRFTGHTEDWGTFMDVKDWPVITNPKKYAGQKVIIGDQTAPYRTERQRCGYTDLHKVRPRPERYGSANGNQQEEQTDCILVCQHTG